MDDHELDDILDNALKDFEEEEKREKQRTPSIPTTMDPETPILQTPQTPKDEDQLLSELLKNINLDPESLNTNPDIEKMFENIPEEEKKLLQKFSDEMIKLFDNLENTKGDNTDKVDKDDEDSFKKTIDEMTKMLNKGTQKLDDISEENEDAMVQNLMKMLAGLSGGEEGDDKFQAFLEKIMETLMSPEVLEGPMRELKSKYPIWLEKNKDKISKEEYERVSKQYEYACAIVRVYETDARNIGKLVELMKEMQALGQPPQEIVDELSVEGNTQSLEDLENNCKLQ